MSYRRVGSMRRDPWLMAVWSGEQPLIERASSADLVSWRWTPARCRSNSRRSCCWTGPRVSTCPSSGRQSRSESLPFSRGHGGFGIGADVWRPIRHCRSGGGCSGPQLVGLVTIERLIAAPREAAVSTLMDAQPPVVATGVDQDVACRAASPAWRGSASRASSVA
jgi:hypothetical protein